MRHAKKTPAYKKLTPYLVGLTLLGVTGLFVGGALSEKPRQPEIQLDMPKGADTPGPSDEAPKTAEEGQARKDRTLGPTTTPQSPESQSPASGDDVQAKPAEPSDKGSENPEKPSTTPTAKTPTQKPSATPSETPKANPKPVPDKQIYQFFIADDSEQNRTWCDTRPSGSVRVELGTMYKSHYDDNDPAKAYAAWRVSKEDTTCP